MYIFLTTNTYKNGHNGQGWDEDITTICCPQLDRNFETFIPASKPSGDRISWSNWSGLCGQNWCQRLICQQREITFLLFILTDHSGETLNFRRKKVQTYNEIFSFCSFSAHCNFGCEHTNFHEFFPGIRSRLAVHDVNFSIPFIREIYYAIGFISPSKTILKNFLLKSNKQNAECNQDGFTSNAVRFLKNFWSDLKSFLPKGHHYRRWITRKFKCAFWSVQAREKKRICTTRYWDWSSSRPRFLFQRSWNLQSVAWLTSWVCNEMAATIRETIFQSKSSWSLRERIFLANATPPWPHNCRRITNWGCHESLADTRRSRWVASKVL